MRNIGSSKISDAILNFLRKFYGFIHSIIKPAKARRALNEISKEVGKGGGL